ncbi:hypothetical protein ACNS7O_03605 [Haloferacaceae archaeon DSL9]
MWLFAHAALGYLVGRKTSLPTRWCVFGAVLPDLIDKSLGLSGVFPAYQTVSHSLIGVAVACSFVAFDGRATAAVVGWVSHLVADIGQLALNGRAEHALNMLLWPVRHWENEMLVDPTVAHYEGVFAGVPFIQEGYVRYYLTTPAFAIELVICLYALALALPSVTALRADAEAPASAGRRP